MGAHIEYREGVEPWYPESEVFNWRERRLAKLAMVGEVELPALFIKLDDGSYEQRLNELNSMVFLNTTDDDMDGVAIIDERDGCAWWWFRGTHPEFETLVAQVAPYATVAHNDCPQDQVEHNFLRITESLVQSDIDHLLD